MAKKITPLTDTQIKTAKAKDKNYSLYDGYGLLLLVKTNSCKIWQFRYYKPFINKRTTISFGSYPEVSLQQARKQREEARKLIKQDIDPKEQREAERMKMDRLHNVPLSIQAIRLLDIMKPISSQNEYIFPSMKPPYNKPMNSSTANMAIKRMGFQGRLVAHGLRSLASTALNEQGFNFDVIESALSHIDKNAIRRAYNRAEYDKQKRIMLDWWGDFVEQTSKGNVSLSGNKALKIIS